VSGYNLTEVNHSMSQSVERFSSRVENYVKYRPNYPAEIIPFLQSECDLMPDSIVADIGSGTGKLTELFLKFGNLVFGVEPNERMRAAAEKLLVDYSNFKSVSGTAERTTLANSSVDLISAGQAFHWFNPGLARIEATRILKPHGWVALIWNDRKLQSTPFLEDYEALLLKYGTDYKEVRHDKATHAIAEFFSPQPVMVKVFPNEQVFDLDGLKGRVLSSSYTPEPNHSSFPAMIDELSEVFAKHEKDGGIVFEYDTKVFYGQM
jgi:SAM-dependent methyltransferase